MSKENLNFIFWGTPDVASETLEILKQGGFLPLLIITAPDRPAGRKMLLTPPPVKTWAIENNIPYIQPEKITHEEVGDVLRTLGRSGDDGQRKFSTENFHGKQNIPDLFVIVAYGKILSEEIINMPRLGSINIHYSLLPKYRGASPVESAILHGDTETGVTIQQMEYKMDSGPILAQEKIEIYGDEKAPELRKRLIKIGGELLIKTLDDVFLPSEKEEVPKAEGVKQNEDEATFCTKIKKEDGLIDLNGDPNKNYNKFRAYTHWPRTYYFDKNNNRVIITDAVLENDKFVIKKVIPEGGKEIDHKINI